MARVLISGGGDDGAFGAGLLVGWTAAQFSRQTEQGLDSTSEIGGRLGLK